MARTRVLPAVLTGGVILVLLGCSTGAAAEDSGAVATETVSPVTPATPPSAISPSTTAAEPIPTTASAKPAPDRPASLSIPTLALVDLRVVPYNHLVIVTSGGTVYEYEITASRTTSFRSARSPNNGRRSRVTRIELPRRP
jgi:hypothetical protein